MKHVITITCSVFLLLLVSCGTDSLSPTSKDGKNDENKVCVTAGYKDVTEISVTLSGYANLTSDMTGDIKMGVVCSTNPVPDLKNGIMKTTRELNADNLFSVSISGLQCGEKHYYRAFVYRNDVYTYGEIKSFETLDINASVTTEGASGITENAATITGSLSFSPKANLSAKKGFYVSSTNSSKPDKWYSASSGFSTQLTNLEYGKTYYYMAAAIINDLVFTGSVKSFSTETIEVSVSTGDAKNVSEHKATVLGTIKKTKPYDRLTQEAFIIYSSKNNTLDELKKNNSYNIRKPLQPSGNGEVSLYLEDLTQSTQYYYVIGFTIGGFEFWGDVKSFTTTKITVSFSNLRISDINELSAMFYGTVSYNVIENLPISASLCYSQYKPSQDQSRSFGQTINLNGLPSNGKITQIIEGLRPSTRYYCALYVQIGESSFLSDIFDFTTPTITATLQITSIETKSYHDITVNGKLVYSTVCDLNTLGVKLEGEIEKGLWKGSGSKPLVFSAIELFSDGSFRANLPGCTPTISNSVVFYATILDQKFYSERISFVPPLPDNYKVFTFGHRSDDPQSITINGKFVSYKNNTVAITDPTYGEGRSVVIDGIEIRYYIGSNTINNTSIVEYYLRAVQIIAPSGKRIKSVLCERPHYVSVTDDCRIDCVINDSNVTQLLNTSKHIIPILDYASNANHFDHAYWAGTVDMVTIRNGNGEAYGGFGSKFAIELGD